MVARSEGQVSVTSSDDQPRLSPQHNSTALYKLAENITPELLLVTV